MYWIATCDPNAYRWRFRGNVPPFENFQATLHNGVLAQFVVHSHSTPASANNYKPQGCARAAPQIWNSNCQVGYTSITDGRYVTAVQSTLQGNLLFPNCIDGLFGPVTDSAVQQYQQNNGLTQDGVVGPDTWTNLYGDVVGTQWRFGDYVSNTDGRYYDVYGAGLDDSTARFVKASELTPSEGRGEFISWGVHVADNCGLGDVLPMKN